MLRLIGYCLARYISSDFPSVSRVRYSLCKPTPYITRHHFHFTHQNPAIGFTLNPFGFTAINLCRVVNSQLICWVSWPDLSSVKEPIKLTDDLKEPIKRLLNNNQIPARAYKTTKKCHRFLHRCNPPGLRQFTWCYFAAA